MFIPGSKIPRVDFRLTDHLGVYEFQGSVLGMHFESEFQ